MPIFLNINGDRIASYSTRAAAYGAMRQLRARGLDAWVSAY